LSGNFLLDWASMAFSLFNTILLVWLGLTVLLNAERRTWGVWLAAEGLLMGAAFFISHSAILGQNPYSLFANTGAWPSQIEVWWHAGWGLVIASPFAWYVLMLWYTGFWDSRESALYRRQLPWFVLSVLLTLFMLGLLIFANPLPDFVHAVQLDLSGVPALGGIPLLILAFPIYILLCIFLSLDGLLRPAPSGRLMGDMARRRARPWLLGSTFVLLAVSLLVGCVLFWLVAYAQARPIQLIDYIRLATTLAWFDLALAALLAVTILLLGQAIVSYEVFTGKVLPRRGFLRQWRNIVILAGGASTLAAWSLTSQLHPIYTLLLALLLMTVFYALSSWRSYEEHEQSIRRLRPFTAGPRLYETLLAPASQPERSAGAPLPEADLNAPFSALCADVLGVRQALLVPSGPLAALAGAPLRFPVEANLQDTGSPAFPVAGLLAGFTSPHTLAQPLDPARYQGMAWAVPLWSERGLIGLLLLGEKSDGGFFSQEEIEVARASGERLVDIQASTEMARRLMALQRQRLAEGQVLDRRGRRMLHDEALPRLHTALLALSSLPPENQVHLGQAGQNARREAIDLLVEVHHQISDLLREIPAATAPELGRLGLAGALQQVLENELKDAFDGVDWQVSPAAAEGLPGLPALSAEVIFYAAREAMRNAALHARPVSSSTPLHLRVTFDWPAGLCLSIEDDGVGLGSKSAPARAGSGQGLALHSTLMAVIGGSLALESVPGEYTRVVLSLPG
jgi:signal transduction histidine kinase